MNFFTNHNKPTVSLHPTNTRNTNSNNNQSTTNSTSLSNSFSNLTTKSPSRTTIKSTRPLSPSSSNNQHHQSTQSQLQSQQRLKGIKNQNQKFQIYSNSSTHYPIKLIKAKDFNELYKEYLSLELPIDTLFPYLHTGTEIKDSNSCKYFGYNQNSCAKRPLNYRGLTIITPTPPSNSSTLPSSHLLVSTLPLSQLLSSPTSNSITTFKNVTPLPEQNVNLRGFGNQGSKYGRCCDVVIYGVDGLKTNKRGEIEPSEIELIDLAERVGQAMRYKWRKDGRIGDEAHYNIFVVVDPFSTFEQDFPELVAIDSNGYVLNKLDFAVREAEEMRVLTRATKISNNVYLGNTRDVPDLPSPPSHSSSSFSSNSSSTSYYSVSDALPTSNSVKSNLNQFQSNEELLQLNPLAISVCVEGHENAIMPTEEDFKSYELILERCEFENQVSQEGEFEFDHIESENRRKEERVPQNILHLETIPSTLSLADDNPATVSTFLDSLLEQAFWLHSQANNQQNPRNVLFHCRDGYTETSLLSIVYTMISERKGVAEAYLQLQNGKEIYSTSDSNSIEDFYEGRSFFVYEKDLVALKALEIRVERWLKERDEIEWKKECLESCTMGRSDSGFEEELAAGLSSPTSKALEAEKVEGEVDPILTEELVEKWLESEWKEKQKERMFKKSSKIEHPWYFSDSWEGSFPSKIIDGLYLGNLAHATNALMLKSIGITHVVSVGESALFPPSLPPLQSRRTSTRTTSLTIPNSLWLESQSPNPSIKVLDLKNINDDGIDSIKPPLDLAIQFIDEAKRNGGKVLVHCRVGVSRSASVVIGYLMKYQEWDLVSAYLLTRSRRLNILIQPNLPFVATLHAFEAELIKEKEINDLIKLNQGEEVYSRPLGETGLRNSNRLTWSSLCTEIYYLNQRFLEW